MIRDRRATVPEAGMKHFRERPRLSDPASGSRCVRDDVGQVQPGTGKERSQSRASSHSLKPARSPDSTPSATRRPTAAPNL